MSLLQDLRFAFRILAKSPLLSLTAILSLALAIGANTAIYTMWNAVFNHPLAVSDPATLVNLYTQDSAAAAGSGGVSIPYLGVSHLNFDDYVAGDTAVFSGMYMFQDIGATMTVNGQSESVPIEIATGDYFQVLGVSAVRGRVFSAAETSTDGQGAVVVLSHAFWSRRFGSDPALVGQTITLDNQNFLVAGIAPAGFTGTQTLFGPDLWAPMSMHDTLLNGAFKDYYNIRRGLFFNAVARLRPGVSLATARAAVAVTARQLEQQYPVDNHARTATLLTLTESAVGPNQRANLARGFGMMLAVVGLVLLIACANVANLLLARALGRRREISVRLALGASRARLIRQLLVESLLMGTLAGIAGLMLASWARDLLWAHRPPGLVNPAFDLSLDGRVLFYAALLSLGTGLLFGLAPAWQASGGALAQRLGERGEAATGTHRLFTLRGALLVGEIAFAFIALVGAGLFLASLRQIQRIDPGFDAPHIASLTFNLGTGGLDAAHQEVFRRTLLDRAQALPGVAAATLASGTPMAASAIARTYTVEGEVPIPGKGTRFVSVEDIAPRSFFTTYGIPLIEGRDFTDADTAQSQQVVIVNETFAKQAWPHQDALGKRLKFFRDTNFTQVIGVARDSKYFSLSENPTEMVYVPFTQFNSPNVGLTVRTQGPPETVLAEMRAAVSKLDPTLAITNLQTAEVPIANSLWPAQMTADLLTVLALLALVLAAIGIYGVMAFGVRQSQREIGIRMAIGATPANVMRQVFSGGMRMVAVGLALGIAGALLLGRLIATFLVGVTPADPTVYLEYSALFASVALLAAYLPARRATTIDPVRTLRQD